MDGRIDGPTDQPTKRGVESRSTRLKKTKTKTEICVPSVRSVDGGSEGLTGICATSLEGEEGGSDVLSEFTNSCVNFSIPQLGAQPKISFHKVVI